MNPIKISEKDIEKHIYELSKIGRVGDSASDGFLRAAWSAEESQAFEYISTYAMDAGLVSNYDGIGNLFVRTPNNLGNVVQTGSHLDTVPEGGNYDGVAGIVAGLEAIKRINDMGMALSKDIELVVWRGEEGSFGEVYKGSKAAFGEASPEFLKNKFQGLTLEEAINSQHFSPGYIKYGRPTLTQGEIDGISAHLELHIEQGTRLERDMIDIGNVTSIRGSTRYLVVVEGDFDHSGATPMGNKYRRDANLSIAHMQVNLDRLAKPFLLSGDDFVQTVGEVNTNPTINKEYPQLRNNSLAKVSGFGYFTLDVRSSVNSFRREYVSKVEEAIRETAKEHGVNVDVIEQNDSGATESLSSKIQSKIKEACDLNGYSTISMPSGAGHDAKIVGNQTQSDGGKIPIGMIFVPCKNGKSHCKEEFASTEAMTKGANVLGQVLYSLSSE
jgi:hydantoinase/carbamoylase family amidase